MDLVVACDELALLAEKKRAVGDLAVGGPKRQRPDMEHDAELAGERREAPDRRVAWLRRDRSKKRRPVALDDIGHLRRLHVVGTAPNRLADEPLHRFDILADIGRRAELNAGRLERHAAASDASSLSSSPRAFSA